MTRYCSKQASKSRPKQFRKRKKTIYRWLRERTSSIDYGMHCKGHPIHCNTNREVLNAFNGGRWLSRMTNEKYDAHFSGDKTFYFTGAGSSRCSETLLNIDIDCHTSGTLAGAIAFAQHLRDNFFPKLYFEVSTNGNGVHAYVVIQKADLGSVFLNGLFKRLEQHLRRILLDTEFDVENVEIKGTCPVFVWGERKAELQNYTSGVLAKLPRDSHRFEELQNTTRLTYHDLLKLPAVERKRIASCNTGLTVKRPVLAGSISGKVIGSDELIELNGHYRKVAETLMEVHALKTTGRTVATVDDLAIFLMLLRYFTLNMNRDGSLPYSRFRGLWTAMYACGDVDRCFDDKRFAALRNYLSSLGLLVWDNNTFTFGSIGADGKWKKGKACKWHASDLLMSLLDVQSCEAKHNSNATVYDDQGERGEGASLTGTKIRELICSLTQQQWKDIRKPVLSDLSSSCRIPDDDITSYIIPFDEIVGLAA